MTRFEKLMVGILLAIGLGRIGHDLFEVVTGTVGSGELPFMWGIAMIVFAAISVIMMTPSLLERMIGENPPPPVPQEIHPEWSYLHPNNLPVDRRDAPDGTSD